MEVFLHIHYYFDILHLFLVEGKIKRLQKPKKQKLLNARSLEPGRMEVLEARTCGGVLSEEMGCICMEKFLRTRAFPRSEEDQTI